MFDPAPVQKLFLDPRQRERGRVLFEKSVEYEAEDISEVTNADIREAGRVEAELRISSIVTEVPPFITQSSSHLYSMSLVATYSAVLPS
jgi:hypothetical protein